MANIFGREVEQYQIFRDAFPAGTPRATMQDALSRGGRQIDWAFKPQRRDFRDNAEAVTAAIGLISNNLMAVQAESDEILRRIFQLNEFVPISTNVPEGATSKAINVINRYGKGKFINKDGSNVENAQASVNRVAYGIAYGGVVGSWSLQELRESLFAGIPLNAETITAAIEACNYHIQTVGFVGDSQEGFEGLLTSSKIPSFTGSIPDFSSLNAQGGATADDLVKFVNALITTIGSASNEVLYQHFRTSDLVLAVPTDVFDILTTNRYGDNADKSIWDFLKVRNAWTTRTARELMLKSLPEAGTASAGGGTRIALYPKDKRVLEMDMPIAPRVTTVINKAYSVETPYEYSVSGVNVKRGGLCLYADDVMGEE